MAKILNIEQVRGVLKKRQAGRSQVEYARALGVSQQHLCDVMKRRKDPGPSILKALGIERQVRYVVNA